MWTLPANVQSHVEGRNTFPVRLFKIEGNTTLYYTDLDESVTWNGNTWTPRGVSYSRARITRSYETDTYTVTLDNMDDGLIAWTLSEKPIGNYVTVYKGFVDEDTIGNVLVGLIDDHASTIFRGRITSFSADNEFELNVKSGLDLHAQRGPRVMQHTLCRFQGHDGFKGPNCGYAGSETECDYTFKRCKELENERRFGGFPDISSNSED